MGKQPLGLVFMLHSSAGAYTPLPNREPLLDNFAEKTLAKQCFLIVLPHYLQVLHRASLTATYEMIADAPQLLSAANVLLIGVEESAPGLPVFFYGESLGAFIAVSLSLQRPEIRAVSEISGGYIGDTAAEPKNRHLAVLISHGAKDDLVSMEQAHRLHSYCRRFEKPVVADIYPAVAPYFPPGQKLRCVKRTGAFFKLQRQ